MRLIVIIFIMLLTLFSFGVVLAEGSGSDGTDIKQAIQNNSKPRKQ